MKAVDAVDFSVSKGEILGIVGESGSGKSTIARLVLRLIEPSAGKVVFDGEDMIQLSSEKLRLMRRHMQLVFQNPHSALNGRHTIGDAIAEPFRIQSKLSRREIEANVDRLLDIVQLPRVFRYRYPHELSGGQKQRVCIARAVALSPKLLVLDEPTSALDVSVQAQVLKFLREPARGDGSDLRLHFARSGGRARIVRPRARHAAGPDHGRGHDGRHIRRAEGRLYAHPSGERAQDVHRRLYRSQGGVKPIPPGGLRASWPL